MQRDGGVERKAVDDARHVRARGGHVYPHLRKPTLAERLRVLARLPALPLQPLELRPQDSSLPDRRLGFRLLREHLHARHTWPRRGQ